MALRDPAARVARVFLVRSLGKIQYNYNSSGIFNLVPANHHPNATQIDVPAVILHAWSRYETFEVVRYDSRLWINDLIKTAPDVVVGIEFLIGGRIIVEGGKTAKIVSEGEADTLEGNDWTTIGLPHQGLVSKFLREPKPLRMLNNGTGIMGIKG